MGLRINTNAASLSALRNLRLSDRNLATSLERLSTGLRINRASDDPSGLVISEQLRAQTRSLSQALENTENGSNMIGTAEAALNEVSSLLLGLRESAVFALNTAGASTEQIAAEQDSVNAAIQAIDRIAASTRFGSTKLLDGSSSFKPGTVNFTNANFRNLNIQSVQMDGYATRGFTVNVTTAATLASADTGRNGGQTVNTTATVYAIQGNLGTKTIEVAANTTATNFRDMVNLLTTDTGVYASLDASNDLVMHTMDYGNDQFLNVSVVSGTGNSMTLANLTNARGTNIAGTINGQTFVGNGQKISINSAAISAELMYIGTVTSLNTFSVRANSGLRFQLQTEANVNDSLLIGLRSIATGLMGDESRTINLTGGATITVGGKLSTLATGNSNDLDSNAGNAVRIVDQAIDQVNSLRAQLGSIQSNVLDSNTRTLGIALENLTASESAIRDLDFAAETAEFTKTQILFQASTAVLASANLIPQTILSLLQ